MSLAKMLAAQPPMLPSRLKHILEELGLKIVAADCKAEPVAGACLKLQTRLYLVDKDTLE